jgi:hypothetical protein
LAKTKGRLAWGLVIVLAILHYDFWYWADDSLVFGFMPIGLFYQALISLAAGIAWALVTAYAWPTWVENWADSGDEES